MPNRKVMEAAAETRRQARPRAKRIYNKHHAQVRDSIRRLAGPTQEEHDAAFDLLASMGEFIVPELLQALADPDLDPIAADEVVSLLGTTGDERAVEPLWELLQANLDDEERLYTAALSLAGLGDERVRPYLRQGLESDNEEYVANAAIGMILVGCREDIPLLRRVHRLHRANVDIRMGIANAVLTILGEERQHILNRTLDEIQGSFADRDLWDDIWGILDSAFGTGHHTLH